MNADILVICTNYWNEEDTIDYVNELLFQQQTDSKLDIVVVDNNEIDGENPLLEGIKSASNNVEIYRNGINAGYYGAASWALEMYLKASEMPEWIIVSNTDIRFENQSFLSTLLELYAENAPEVIAPRIISASGELNQNPFMQKRPPAWRMHMYRSLFRFETTYRFYEMLHNVKTSMLKRRNPSEHVYCNKDAPYSIYAPHGSLVIFNKKYFKNGGTLDYGSFLFGEEIFIAETARTLGLGILYEPRITAIHKERATTKTTKKIWRYMHESSTYCAKSYFNRRTEFRCKSHRLP